MLLSCSLCPSVCARSAALSDAEAALRLDGSNSLALYRRATALFYLDQFAAALSAFQQAEQHGNKQSALFIRKCEAELQRQQPNSRTATTAAAAPPAAAPPLAAAPATLPLTAAAGPTTAASSTGSSSSSVGVSPLASRVKESWFQTRSAVTITLFAKSLSKEAVSASVSSSQSDVLSARLQLPDGSVFERQWSLFAPLQPASLRLDITPYRVEVIAAKQHDEEWPGLLASDRKKVEGVVTRDNVLRAEAVSSYPTSSKKKVEWSEVESAASKAEEDDKPQGDAALQKLFQTIYKDANEDTRRAMIKSFQTSGGTVLSTNWSQPSRYTHTHTHEQRIHTLYAHSSDVASALYAMLGRRSRTQIMYDSAPHTNIRTHRARQNRNALVCGRNCC